MMGRSVESKRIERRDRPWVHSYVAAVCGPFAMPSVEAVRAAVRTLTDRYPHSRLDWRLDAGAQRWRLGGDTDSLVVERNWDPGWLIGAALDTIASDDTLPAPLALIRYPRFLGLKMSHSIGDGRMFNTIFSAVLRTALTGEVQPWGADPARRFPLARTMWRTFGARPSRIWAAIDDRPAKPHEPDHGPGLPWTPARRTLFASIPGAQMDEIYMWTRQSAPGSTRAAVQMCLLLRSLARRGVALAPDVNLVVDLRRYMDLPIIDGNFVAGVPLRIGPTASVDEVSARIRATMASGRPLATQALSTLRRGGPALAQDSVDAAALPRVTFSGMGRPPEIAALPFLPGEPAIYSGGVEPDGPAGLTFLISETPTATAITASFHENVIDATVVNAVLALATSDPLGVLSEATVSL